MSESDRAQLLDLARRALDARVRGNAPPPPVSGGALDRLLGAFVSLHHHGELRGCLGRLERDAPLGRTVLDLAQAVSDSDPRFSRVRVDELGGLVIEISVLEPEREIADEAAIDVGVHGLIVVHGRRHGLLLPQVAVEHRWDRETFLEHTCLKAGLGRHAWREGARLFVFKAEVFSESSRDTRPRGDG